MFLCMLKDCTCSFNNAHEYLDHLKKFHLIPTSFRYICTIEKCGQIFSNFFPFKKHTINHLPTLTKNKRQNQPHLNSDSNCIYVSSDVICNKKTKPNEDLDNIHCTSSYDEIERAAFNFTLKLHSKSNFTRKDIYTVQSEVSELLTVLSSNILDLNVASPNPEVDFKFKNTICKMKSLFSGINSDYKLFKYIKLNSGLPLPLIITIQKGKKSVVPIQDLEMYNESSKNFLILMPIAKQIKLFFEHKSIFKLTIENQARLEKSSQISNFVNGTRWIHIKEKYCNDIIIPVWLYADEFEINDPQSSHGNRDSVCGIYFNFPTIPTEHISQLKNIFVAGMLKKVDIKDVGINKLISALLDEFSKIETEGIELNLNKQIIRVRFVMCLLQGDNLGIHSMLQFSTGFNATFYCRFCRRPKELLKTDVIEHADCIRRRSDYEEDLVINKLSDTGIAGWSIFNNLPSFHVVENKCVDAMHDLFSSGVCKYGFVEVLNYYIYNKKYFTLRELNTRKRDVGGISSDSELLRMPDFNESFCSKYRQKSVVLKMTSNEMRVFCHHFTFLVGQYIPLNDIVWRYAIQLIQLVDLCLKRSFTENSIDELKSLIKSHHTEYIKLFGKDLTPKHHFLVHYPSIITSSGPIHNMMCFRNEAKHKGFKQYAHVITSRKNVCYTLCIKSYLQFTNNMLNNEYFTFTEPNNFHCTDLRFRNYFSKLMQPLNIASDFKIQVSSFACYKNTNYKTGQFVAELFSNTVLLYEIIEIILLDKKNYLILQVWKVGCFHIHYQAYECIGATSIVEIICIDFTKPPFSICITNRTINDELKGRRMLFRMKNSFESISS
ncbi:uncharacterized protein LOC131438283 isoform X1 [Malaya genurostris]|uniref:uncharacterized protein LOC131438283 isoform X1 n=1 Tax=Malaya genurostris TaxID=325434 RepID=UPI0026F3A2CA|nr:uncharacterized protein LOC131438283 isoform X1 [Malaya genurostris]XP_058464156.1 uncharacterized protein LOC131438283 isoform X1 [Malaya genurostris]